MPNNPENKSLNRPGRLPHTQRHPPGKRLDQRTPHPVQKDRRRLPVRCQRIQEILRHQKTGGLPESFPQACDRVDQSFKRSKTNQRKYRTKNIRDLFPL